MFDPRYEAFFDCFNDQRFFEAHEVLEALWLPVRRGPDGNFHKALIQIAGAFVHVQKRRPGPAIRLLEAARSHLRAYPPRHLALDVAGVLTLIDSWLGTIRRGETPPVPRLELSP